jgi:glutamate racemase
MSKNKSVLGIIDWGIGGISIYKLIKEQLGDIPIVYFSDTGVTPYGKMSRPEMVSRLNDVIAYLQSRGVTHLVIGCNAASTAIPYLKVNGMKIEGVIDSAVAATARLKPKQLGLIGGRRTVLSGVYRKAFAERGVMVEQRIAQPLSGLIESGDISSEKLRSECKKILSPLKNCSHILLACTHYPAISQVMQHYVSIETKLIDPASELVNKLSKWNISNSHGLDIFLTSGDRKQMKISARKAFGVKIDTVEKIRF